MSKSTVTPIVHTPEILPATLSAQAEQEITDIIAGKTHPVSTSLTVKQTEQLPTPPKLTKALLKEARERYIASEQASTLPRAEFGVWLFHTFYAGIVKAYTNTAWNKTNPVKALVEDLTASGYPGATVGSMHKSIRAGIVWEAIGDLPGRGRLTFSHLVAIYSLKTKEAAKLTEVATQVIKPKALLTRDQTVDLVSEMNGKKGERTKQNAAKAAEGESQEGGESGSEGQGEERATPVQVIAGDVLASLDRLKDSAETLKLTLKSIRDAGKILRSATSTHEQIAEQQKRINDSARLLISLGNLLKGEGSELTIAATAIPDALGETEEEGEAA
jgi:hypothetical protein